MFSFFSLFVICIESPFINRFHSLYCATSTLLYPFIASIDKQPVTHTHKPPNDIHCY